MDQQTIVFFDGACGLCNKTVDFVLRHDRKRRFLFAPLQGETFRQIVRVHPETLYVDSIFVLRRAPDKEVLLCESGAFLYILENLPRFRWLAQIGYLFPPLIRNAAYRLIAKTRYRIWGKRDTCRLPSLEERTRFLP
jgi:predicted DCC family thiol-disulfide oxidoreductase YuxK